MNFFVLWLISNSSLPPRLLVLHLFIRGGSLCLPCKPSPGQIRHANSNFVSLDVCQIITELVTAIGQVQSMGVGMLGMVDV